MKKKRLHIIGTHGVPARYGGFETLADYLCQKLNKKYDITVYCSSKKYDVKPDSYHGVKLEYINLSASGFSGIIYDSLTFVKSLFSSDVILYLSPVGSGFITPLSYFSKTKVIVNHGGLNEWEREKLSWLQKKWAKFNHQIAAKFANINIADNELYKKSIKNNLNAESVVIRYGGDHVGFVSKTKQLIEKYPFTQEKYAVSVSRAQIDNNLHIVLESFEKFSDFKLVLISNWEVSAYGKNLKQKYSSHPNIILLDAIYDKEELDYLRSNAYFYIHSHSRCGTAPSLVEAMCLKKAIFSFDVPTNRETLNNKGIYFSDSDNLLDQLNKINDKIIASLAEEIGALANEKYSWKYISEQYQKVIDDL